MSTDRDDWDEDERAALTGLGHQLETIRQRHRDDPPFEVLHAARHDVLPGEWQARVNAHLSSSAWSRAIIQGLAPADASLSDPAGADAPSPGNALDADAQSRLFTRIVQEASGTPQASPRRWLHRESLPPGPIAAEARAARARSVWVWPACAGAAAVAAVLLVIVARGGIGTQTSVPSPTPAPEQRQTAARPIEVPRTPPFQLSFDKPDVRLSASALTWRGPSTSTRPPDGNAFIADLKPALDAYRTGQYAQADARFVTLRTRYPASIEAAFYQGATRLLLGNATGAIESLTAAEAAHDPAFAFESTWLLAVAEQRAGRVAAARARLRAACVPADPQTSRACTALGQLDAAATPAGGR